MLPEKEVCPDCASFNIVRSQIRDQIICRDCGLIFEPLLPPQAAMAATHLPSAKRARAKRKPSKRPAKKKAKKRKR